jgi:thiol-disulfide isomerase/thioredoxin
MSVSTLFRVPVTALLVTLFALPVASQTPPPATLPNFVFQLPAGTAFPSMLVPRGKPVVVMFFNPDCEHCQHEASEIAANAADFAGVNFYLVTTEAAAAAEAFRAKYFNGTSLSVTVLLDKHYKFDSWFGNSPFPSLYVYNGNHQLQKYYRNEEVPVETLLQALGR